MQHYVGGPHAAQTLVPGARNCPVSLRAASLRGDGGICPSPEHNKFVYLDPFFHHCAAGRSCAPRIFPCLRHLVPPVAASCMHGFALADWPAGPQHSSSTITRAASCHKAGATWSRPLPCMAQSQGTVLPHLLFGSFRQLLGCGLLVQAWASPGLATQVAFKALILEVVAKTRTVRDQVKGGGGSKGKLPFKGSGKGKGKDQQAVGLASLPVADYQFDNSLGTSQDPQHKVLGSLLAGLQKQDKAALTPELQRLLEEQQQANSSKLLTKSLHKATTKQGSARKDLQRLRGDRVTWSRS